MATKKAASAKKSKPTVAKQTRTKVTTVKAVAADVTPKLVTPKSTGRTGTNRSTMLGVLIAEFVGTFILASVAVLTKGEPLYVGFTMIAVVLLIGALSGAHVNPLITVGAWATRKISGKRALGYLVAQILGALLALVVMTTFAGAAPKQDPQAAMLGQQTAATLFKASPVTAGKEWFVFSAELLGAAIFGFAVSSAMRERRNSAARAMTVGLGLFSALIVAGVAASYSGASAVVNPALAFTVSAVDWHLNNLWSIFIYVVAPIVGGTIGFFLYDVLRGDEDDLHLKQD